MMVRKKDQFHMKELLTEAITVLCKASLTYRAEFNIEGLIGITLDNEEIFLVNINEHIQKELAQKQSPAASPLDTSEIMNRHRQIHERSPVALDKKRLCVGAPSTIISSAIKQEDVSEAHLYDKGDNGSPLRIPFAATSPLRISTPSGHLAAHRVFASQSPQHSPSSTVTSHRHPIQEPSSTAIGHNHNDMKPTPFSCKNRSPDTVDSHRVDGGSCARQAGKNRPPQTVDSHTVDGGSSTGQAVTEIPSAAFHKNRETDSPGSLMRWGAPSAMNISHMPPSLQHFVSSKLCQSSQESAYMSSGSNSREAMPSAASVIIKQESVVEASRDMSPLKKSDVNRNWSPRPPVIEVPVELNRGVLNMTRPTTASVICSRVGSITQTAPTTSSNTGYQTNRCLPPHNIYPDISDESDSDSDHLVIATDSADEAEPNCDTPPKKTGGESPPSKEGVSSPKQEEPSQDQVSLPHPVPFTYSTQAISVPEFPSFTHTLPHVSESQLGSPNPKGLIFPCTQCDAKFDRRYGLTQHMAQSHGAKTHDCKKCGKHFLSKQCLYQHMRIVHTDKQHTCVYCNMRISTRQKLQLHQRRRHPEHPVTG